MTWALIAILAPLVAMLMCIGLRRAATYCALAGAVASAGAALMALASLHRGEQSVLELAGLPGLPLRLLLEPLTASLGSMVGVVGALVVLYAVGYMRGAHGQSRFFAELSFFIAAMQALAFAGDWVLFVAAWELIGFASFLLIGFELDDSRSGPAASQAFLTTRGADLALYLGVFALISSTATSDIRTSLVHPGPLATLAGALLLVGAMGKSAQPPFQTWLAAAMVAPTPVSALLHSATLVASGAILLFRIEPLLTPGIRLMVGIVGGVAAVLTGCAALVEKDLKRLLAASTSSQLGFMFLALGAGAPGAALAHLLAHAAMKSALFQGAGVFQHARGTTGFDGLGGVGKAQRKTFIAFVLAGLALAEVPPLVGFFSKDAIISATFSSRWELAALAIAGTLLTGAYVARAIQLLWVGSDEAQAVPGLRWMGAGLVGLSLVVIGLGPLLRPLVRTDGLEMRSIEIGWALGVGLVAAATGLVLGSRKRRWFPDPVVAWLRADLPIAGGFETLVVRPAFTVARFSNAVDAHLTRFVLGLGQAAMDFARGCATVDDRGIARNVDLLARRLRQAGAQVRRLQNGLVFRELLFASIGVLVLIAALAAWNFF